MSLTDSSKMGRFEIELRCNLQILDECGFGSLLRGILTGKEDQSDPNFKTSGSLNMDLLRMKIMGDKRWLEGLEGAKMKTWGEYHVDKMSFHLPAHLLPSWEGRSRK